jgi:hypothetical protein
MAKQNYKLSGHMICRLMRKHKVTIGGISTKFQIPKTRVREIRTKGCDGFLANDWHRLITGRWLDQDDIDRQAVSMAKKVDGAYTQAPA